MKRMLVCAVVLAAWSGEAADCCTFDFAAASRAIFEKDNSDNPELAVDPLGFRKGTPQIWTPEAKADLPCEVPEVVSAMVAERDGTLYSMKSPESLIGVVGKKKAEWLHDFATMRVELPDDKGGEYVAKFLYRANHVVGNSVNGCYLILRDGDRELGRLNAPDTGADSDYWHTRNRTFKIPAGVRFVDCDFRLDGIAYLKFSGFSFKRAVAEVVPDVSFYVKPYDAIDGRFAIEAGNVGAVELNWKRREGYKLEWWKDALELIVPRGFELAGLNMRNEKRPLVRTRRPDGSEVVLAPMSRRISPQSSHYTYNNGQALGLLIRSTGSAGSSGTLRYRAVDADGRTIGKDGSLTLFAIEPYVAVEPKRYLAGMMMTYDLQFFRTDPAANAAYADSLRKLGIRWIMPQADWMVEDPSLLPMWRSKGFDYITSTDHDYLMNAYKIRGSCPRPPEENFVKRPDIADDWAFREGRSSCPAAIYEERPFFVTNIVPNLAKRNAGADGQWVNWEPYMYRGCYCDHCKKLGEEWMKRTGDSNIEHFHSWQHGQLVKTIHKWMKKSFMSAKVGLMPAISWEEMCTHSRKVGYPEDKLSADFADEIDWIPAWGPYAGWAPWEQGFYGGPYNPMAPRLLQVFFAAKDVREETDRFFKPGKRPKLMGQPAGANWAIQPEWLETSCDAFFFNRWEAICPWVFPQGADARHAQAYARSITRAAKYEEPVWDGVRNDAATTLTYKPGFEVFADCFDKVHFPDMRNTPYIQQTTYDHKGARYVACFNFYDERHAEFTLRTKGLEGSYRVFDEGGNALFGGKSFTGAELAETGVELSVDVSRCAVFELRRP